MCKMTSARPKAVAPPAILTSGEAAAIQAIVRRALSRAGGWEIELQVTLNAEEDDPSTVPMYLETWPGGGRPHKIDYYVFAAEGRPPSAVVNQPKAPGELPINEYTLARPGRPLRRGRRPAAVAS